MPIAVESNLERNLVDFLQELALVQDELLDVLNRKRNCLARGVLVEFHELQAREEAVIERLTACQQKRSQLLCKAQELGIDSENLSDLAKTLDHQHGSQLEPQLQPQVRQLRGRMRILQSGTLTNWLLAQRTLLHIAQLIEIIATGGQMQPTYAVGESVQPCGSLLNREA